MGMGKLSFSPKKNLKNRISIKEIIPLSSLFQRREKSFPSVCRNFRSSSFRTAGNGTGRSFSGSFRSPSIRIRQRPASAFPGNKRNSKLGKTEGSVFFIYRQEASFPPASGKNSLNSLPRLISLFISIPPPACFTMP